MGQTSEGRSAASRRSLSPTLAAWRPQPGRHNIAEQVVHAAYWKYTARRLLRGDRRGSFPLKGSNWFAVEEPLTDTDWRSYLHMLDTEHQSFREALVTTPSGRLDRPCGKGKYSFRALLLGVPSHDLYHAGQIQLIKRLYEA